MSDTPKSRTQREQFTVVDNIDMQVVCADIAEEFESLLREAQTMLVHNRCVDEDAMKCQGCALEARIQEALR